MSCCCCCCAMFPYEGVYKTYKMPQTLVRDAIDTGNRKFFNKQVEKNKQDMIVSVKINNKYSILEYTIMRNQTELLFDLLDDSKWGLTKLEPDMESLSKVIRKVCSYANKRGDMLHIEDVRTSLRLLESKGIPTKKYERMLDKCVLEELTEGLALDVTEDKHKPRCLIM